MPFLFDQDKPFSSWTLQGLYGAPTLLFENIESTHLYLHNHFRELYPGTLIVANSQTAGHGRHNRPWVSPVNKNLYFNLFIPLAGIQESYFSQITQIAAISLAQILKIITSKSPLNGQMTYCGIDKKSVALFLNGSSLIKNLFSL